MEVEFDLREILMKISDEKNKEEEYANVDSRRVEFDAATGQRMCNGIEADEFVFMNKCYKKFDGKISLDHDKYNVKDVVEMSGVGYDEEHLKSVNRSRSVECGTDEVMKSSVVRENETSRKRKRESSVDLLRWVTDVAKDPCGLSIGSLPERSKWKCYTSDVIWKQVLLLRDEMLLKNSADTIAQCSVWQKKQKMHPSMYDDNAVPERVRCSRRVLVAKNPSKKALFSAASSSSLSSPSDEDLIDGPADSSTESGVGLLWNQRRKRIPVGPQFQADIPEWRLEKCESDSKWLGTQIWPLDKQDQNRMLIERDPIGKGRQDTCGCQYPVSYDCVKFHLAEKRKKVKLELGPAFYRWKFDVMGEEVALYWTKEQQKKFQDIVILNPLSVNEGFWKEIFKLFPNKSRESLVSYYFNVFLLRLRGQQNRMAASNIDSDNDEPEFGPRTNCFGRDSKFSIFCSPRKAHKDPI